MRLLRFSDLVDLGIVNNRVTLSRRIKNDGFPPGFKLGPNSRAWPAEEVEAWIAERRATACTT